jgi:ubiquinone/menaquinone biosynthesis C-methylase UbiE
MKIHLGCWHRYIPGFVHVDYCDMPHIDYKSTIESLPFFDDNQAELIYCSHALEYFDRVEAETVLQEWKRVLKPGGILRLAVPNFPALIEVYQQTGELARVLGPLYGRMQIEMEQGAKTLYHKTTYDEKSLTELLSKVGFQEPEVWDWRLTEHADVDDHSQAYFPHMQKETGLLISLNMQAKK